MSTGIQWTDRTWNPITGCTRVSAGCANCYAQTLHNRRYRFNVMAAREQDEYRSKHAPTAIHRIRSLGPSRLPFPHQYDTPFAMVQTWEHKLLEPLHWRKPQRVFVNRVPVFVKQVSKNPIDGGHVMPMKHSHGGDPNEWPADLRVREFPR